MLLQNQHIVMHRLLLVLIKFYSLENNQKLLRWWIFTDSKFPKLCCCKCKMLAVKCLLWLFSRRFDEKHLGQIKTVLPTAYHFRQEKDLPSGTGGKISDYQLTVDAVLDDSTCKYDNLHWFHLVDRWIFITTHWLSIASMNYVLCICALYKYADLHVWMGKW